MRRGSQQACGAVKSWLPKAAHPLTSPFSLFPPPPPAERCGVWQTWFQTQVLLLGTFGQLLNLFKPPENGNNPSTFQNYEN